MPNTAVYNMAGEKVSELALNESVFAIEPNTSLMHLAVVSYLANQRQGTQSTKTRSEVSGGGKKPWRQKGSGRARQGSTRSPQWYHGGIALGPKPREYGFKLPKKQRQLALKSALSCKVADDEMKVLDTFKLDAIKTKDVVKVLAALNTAKKVLIVLADNDNVIYRSARNIAGVKVATVGTINTYDVLNCDTLVVTKDAVAKLEEVYVA